MLAKNTSKEAYFTASQSQLIWGRFKRKNSALIAGVVLVFMIFCAAFAPFLSPYAPNAGGRNADYINGAPQMFRFCDTAGCSFRPFIHKIERHRGIETNFRWVTRQNAGS